MKPYTQLTIDIYEGSGDFDTAVLYAGGVRGAIIRLNDMNGGHHQDNRFNEYWKLFEQFARAPYFVFNPWVSAQANYDWLSAHIPPECKTIFIDIEVRYDGISSSAYAAAIEQFMRMSQQRWHSVIYTGYGFYDLLSRWPTCEYWWAQYPNVVDWSTIKTWEQLQQSLDTVYIPANKQYIPGVLRMWQFSGDKLLLPGTERTIDCNQFYGTEDELQAFFNDIKSPQLPPPTGEDPLLVARVAELERRIDNIKAL